MTKNRIGVLALTGIIMSCQSVVILGSDPIDASIGDATPDARDGSADGDAHDTGAGGKSGSAGHGGVGGAAGHAGASGVGGVGGSGGSGGSPLQVMEERAREEGVCTDGQVWLFGACFP